MKQLFYIVSILTLLCCSGHPGQVKIRGRFAHLEQGEFFIYSSQGGTSTLDTLHIQDGEFTYTADIDGPAVMQVLYPNYSQLALFVSPGDDIKLKGDAQHLNAGRGARKIYDSLRRACPQDVDLIRLSGAVQAHGKLAPGSKLPDFKLYTRPSQIPGGPKADTICRSDYKNKYLIITFWAGRKSGSQSGIYRSKKLRRDMKAKGRELNIISYSLDTDGAYLRDLEKRDSVNFPSYCDYKAFSSDLAAKWHIRHLPFFVLVDTTQNIIASGSDWSRDIEPKARKLCL